MFGIRSPSMRVNVGSGLALDKAPDIARSHEIAQAQLKAIAESNDGPHQPIAHAVDRWFVKRWLGKHAKQDAPITSPGPRETESVLKYVATAGTKLRE